MATYYVRPDGSNSNTGTGQAAGQAWQTLTYALANATLPDATNIIYVAPGTYRETPTMTITPSSGATLTISGNPTASQFTGINAGIVRLTSFVSDDTVPATGQTFTSAKGYWTLENFYIDGYQASTNFTTGIVYCSDANNITVQNCLISSHAQVIGTCISLVRTTATAFNCTIKNCIFLSDEAIIIQSPTTGSVFSTNVSITDCVCMYGGIGIIGPGAANGVGNGVTISNCLFSLGRSQTGITVNATAGTTAVPTVVTNCNFIGFGGTTTAMSATTTGQITQTYNRFSTSATLTNVASSATSKTGVNSIEFGHSRLFGLGSYQMYAPWQNSPAINAGTSTGTPLVDMFGTTWNTPATPDIAPAIRTNVSAIGTYNPTERNASTITIAPGSTSQSIELYLGATGLTASTSGLSARYNRTRTASVSIPLVARTIAQAWTAGGFAEVDSTNMPGVYRLDVPDAALAAGADDVTIVVRGASGTNGAVMTVKLSSGGLTSAQTASAVWGADPTSYVAETAFGGVINATRNIAGSTEILAQNAPSAVWDELTINHTTHGTFGYNSLRADQASKQGLVTLSSAGNVNRVDADVHAIANDIDAATELKGALLHNGVDYISANVLNASAGSPSIGPYTVLPSGAGADNIVDLNVGTASPLVLNLLDGTSAPFNASGATITATVYTAGGSTVTTYTGSIIAGYIGAISVPLSTAVTATSATYTMLVSVVIGTTTTVFGPLKLVVRAI